VIKWKKNSQFLEKNNISYSLLKSTYLKGWGLRSLKKSQKFGIPISPKFPTYYIFFTFKKPGSLM